MPRPRPPSRVDVVTTPLFGISWYGNPGDGTSIVAYCGGGGSAATGIKNFITVRVAGEEPRDIPTGDMVGVALTIVQNPMTSMLHLLVAMGTKVVRYNVFSGEQTGEIDAGVNVNALATNSMTDRLAVGCETGEIFLYRISDERMMTDTPIHSYVGHEKAVCALTFSPRENMLLSSAKDGTARVWQNGNAVATLTCSIEGPRRGPPPKRGAQVLVRGCAFGDLNGEMIYTVASGRRGSAFLSKWQYNNESGTYECSQRTECTAVPISAMSLSGDAGLLALGVVDGTIILWGIERWKPLKTFQEVHDLPVTCIAARPYPVPLKGEDSEDGGVQFHAVSASADSQLAWLTLQRPPRRKKRSVGAGGESSFKSTVNLFVKLGFLLWAFSPVAKEIWDKCEDKWDSSGFVKTLECIRYEGLLAPHSRPGIQVPPY